MTIKALVFGATGATGKVLRMEMIECEGLMGHLLKSPKVTSIVTVGRREFPVPEDAPNKDKLTQHVVDMEKLDDHKNLFEGHNATFCCLGTTRKDAGSAEGFRKIDLDLVLKTGELSKAAGIPHYLLVSSVGANANSWFLYMKTKGEAEEGLKRMEFPLLSIFRPGAIDRRPTDRLNERIALFFLPSIHPSTIGGAMMEEVLNANIEDAPKTTVYNNSQTSEMGTKFASEQ